MPPATPVKILAFSYDEELREAIGFGLSGIGYDAFPVADLPGAITQSKNPEVEAVVASALEPMFEGLTLMTEMKKEKIATPTVVILGPTSPKRKEDALREGFGAVLLFPFTNHELRDALDRVLGHSFLSQQRSERRPINLKATFAADDEKLAAGLVTDLSMGGARVESSESRPKAGDRLRITISDEEKNVLIKGTALVRWTTLEGGAKEKYSFGVKFLFVDGLDQMVLTKILS